MAVILDDAKVPDPPAHGMERQSDLCAIFTGAGSSGTEIDHGAGFPKMPASQTGYGRLQ